MKHIQFTLEFVVLLTAIPLLVFVQCRHDYVGNGKEKIQIETGTASVKNLLVPGDFFPLTASALEVKGGASLASFSRDNSTSKRKRN